VRLERAGGLDARDEAEFVRGSINSDALYTYLGAQRERYAYVFIPYCFGTTWEGATVAPDRSLLIPCLHEEPFARLQATRRALRAVRAVCFHVPAEQALGAAMAGGADAGNFQVVGEGVDTDIAGNAEAFRQRHGIEDPFLLYVGRKGASKNLPVLLEYYARYRFAYPDRPLKLVLIGPGGVYVPPRLERDVIDLGFVPAQDRHDACAAAVALCQPSLLESFSLVIMEAWLCGTPVLVSARCPVTRGHCEASGGGLWFDDYFEFAESVQLLRRDTALRDRLAARGRAYVLANYTWDRVVSSYLDLFARIGVHRG
jgi:glycosyltransferase involved in cell wall biosynthesis